MQRASKETLNIIDIEVVPDTWSPTDDKNPPTLTFDSPESAKAVTWLPEDQSSPALTFDPSQSANVASVDSAVPLDHSVPVWLVEYLQDQPHLSTDLEPYMVDLHSLDEISQQRVRAAAFQLKEDKVKKTKKSWGRKLRKCLGITLTVAVIMALTIIILMVYSKSLLGLGCYEYDTVFVQ